jgi:hypothetical protein
MLEYFKVISAPRDFSDYAIRVHLSNHPNPRNLADGRVHLREVFSLIEYLNDRNQEMTFDGHPGIVTKVEIDPVRKKVVLRVKLSSIQI